MKIKISILPTLTILITLIVSNVWAQETTIKKADLKAGTHVETDLVCMVNDAFMGRKQIPVEYESKTYYGCCQGCVKTIQTQRSVRYSTDPATGKEVDKAKAYIVIQNDGSRKVQYFESAETYKQFKNKG